MNNFNRLVWILIIFCLISTVVWATPNGKVIGYHKTGFDTGLEFGMFSSGSALLIPMRVQYGFADKWEGSFGFGNVGMNTVLDSSFAVAVKYHLIDQKDRGFDLAIGLPLNLDPTYTLAGLNGYLSKDMEKASPYLMLGVDFINFNAFTSAIFPVSAGMVFYPQDNLDVFGGLSTWLGYGSLPLIINFGVSIKA